MQKDLSFILLVIAGIILLGLILYTLKARFSRRYQQTPAAENLDQAFNTEHDILQENDTDFNYNRTVEPIVSDPLQIESKKATDTSHTKTEDTQAEKEDTPRPKKSNKLIALYITANEGQEFTGYDLLQAISTAHFHFGAWSIFHRHQQADGHGKVLFSLAQATEPGIFDADNMGACKCSGLSLFMQLSDKQHTMAAFNIMIEAAGQLAEDLYGTVTDKQGNPITQNDLAQFASWVKEHEQHLLEDQYA